ncbi:hypothetical protein evm_014697 [Chilo suppressalis]|nr:hypothetical protein evm_014697 [Chilo suppressalis]
MSKHPQHKYKNVIKRLWAEIKQLFPDQDNTLAPSHLHGTNNRAGAACEAAEKAKACKYRGLDSEYDFVPFGVETLGPWGPSAMRFFKEISKRSTSLETEELAATSDNELV